MNSMCLSGSIFIFYSLTFSKYYAIILLKLINVFSSGKSTPMERSILLAFSLLIDIILVIYLTFSLKYAIISLKQTTVSHMDLGNWTPMFASTSAFLYL